MNDCGIIYKTDRNKTDHKTIGKSMKPGLIVVNPQRLAAIGKLVNRAKNQVTVKTEGYLPEKPSILRKVRTRVSF
jgi:hypothetical protein